MISRYARHPHRAFPLDWEKIIETYKDGSSMRKVAREFGCSPNAIRYILEKTNTPIRTRGTIRHLTKFGYITIFSPHHPYKTRNNRVLEHRLVMEKHIGRYLQPDEVVHHINRNRADNRIENLVILKKRRHDSFETLLRWNKVSNKDLEKFQKP